MDNSESEPLTCFKLVRNTIVLSLPALVSFSLCALAGMELWGVAKLVVTLAFISGCFAAVYDTMSQVTEHIYWREPGVSRWEAVAAQHDFLRTVRYSGVHFVYNGPYHMPKLLFLNWMYPGEPNYYNALWKWVWATFIFSPGESLGVLSGVQMMRDGHAGNVCAKLRADGPSFQCTKWVGHAIPHYLSFLTTTNIVYLYVCNFGFKAIFEIILSFIAAKPINKHGLRYYGGLDGPALDAFATHSHASLEEAAHCSKKGTGSNYGTV